MLNRIATWQLNAFGRRWGYDTSYMREIVDEAGVGALLPIDGLQKLGKYCHDVPPAVYHAAKMTATRAADCGACLQLVTSMAEAAGVPHPILRAIVTGDRSALPEDVRLGADLAHATIAHDASGEDARERILARWGRRGLVSLAYAIVAGQAFPTLKYALGYGHACVRVRIGANDVAVSAESAVPAAPNATA